MREQRKIRSNAMMSVLGCINRPQESFLHSFRKYKSRYVNHVNPELLALYFFFFLRPLLAQRRSENFYCHKFRLDNVDINDIPRNIFYYLFAFFLNWFPIQCFYSLFLKPSKSASCCLSCSPNNSERLTGKGSSSLLVMYSS